MKTLDSATCNTSRLVVPPSPTVDGRNPAPVDRWFIPLFIGFQHVSTIQGGAGFLPSTVTFQFVCNLVYTFNDSNSHTTFTCSQSSQSYKSNTIVRKPNVKDTLVICASSQLDTHIKRKLGPSHNIIIHSWI